MSVKTRVGIYMRLSKNDTDTGLGDGKMRQESNSITNQRFLLKKYIMEHFVEYELYEYCDDGYSGTNFNRPGITALLEDVKGERLDCVAVKDFSRFSRDYIELGSYIEQVFPYMGIRFISLGDRYDSENYQGTVTELDQNFRNLIYDLYSKDLSVKVKTALQVKREKGVYVSGNTPFGYRKDKKDRHKVLIREEEAAVVRRIFELTRQRLTSGQIARLFNQEEIKTPIQFKIEAGEARRMPKGDRFAWNNTTVCQILRNEFYAGDMVYGKYEKKEVGGKKHIKPRSEWKIYQNHHAPIIDRKTFEQVQRGRGKIRNKKYRNTHPLTGKLLCGCCGKALSIRHGTNPYFQCGYRYFNGRDNCVERVNKLFIEQFVLYMLEQEFIKLAAYKKWKEDGEKKIKERLHELSAEIKSAKSEAVRLDMERKEAYEKYVLGGRKTELYYELIAEYKSKKTKLEMQITKLEKEGSKWQDELTANAETLFEYYDLTELTQEVVDSFIKEIKVYDEKKIEITWKHGLNLNVMQSRNYVVDNG